MRLVSQVLHSQKATFVKCQESGSQDHGVFLCLSLELFIIGKRLLPGRLDLTRHDPLELPHLVYETFLGFLYLAATTICI